MPKESDEGLVNALNLLDSPIYQRNSKSRFGVIHSFGEVTYETYGWMSYNRIEEVQNIPVKYLAEEFQKLPKKRVCERALIVNEINSIIQQVNCNIWVVRCLLPNLENKGGVFDDALVLHQINSFL